MTFLLLFALPLCAQEPAPPPVPNEFFKGRRQELMRRLGEGVVLVTAEPAAAGFRPFYQANEFWYLSGIKEPGLAMLLFPATGRELLLVHPFNRFTATWDGERLAPGEASAATRSTHDTSLLFRAGSS